VEKPCVRDAVVVAKDLEVDRVQRGTLERRRVDLYIRRLPPVDGRPRGERIIETGRRGRSTAGVDDVVAHADARLRRRCTGRVDLPDAAALRRDAKEPGLLVEHEVLGERVRKPSAKRRPRRPRIGRAVDADIRRDPDRVAVVRIDRDRVDGNLREVRADVSPARAAVVRAEDVSAEDIGVRRP
jgi:hypothetical protein